MVADNHRAVQKFNKENYSNINSEWALIYKSSNKDKSCVGFYSNS